MKSSKKSSKPNELSLFDYYIQAAAVAVRMGIGLEYAFKTYVKPHMPESVPTLTPEQAAIICKNG